MDWTQFIFVCKPNFWQLCAWDFRFAITSNHSCLNSPFFFPYKVQLLWQVAILVIHLGDNLDMRSLQENCILSPPARCGISCKFCNVANYIVHCLNAHLMVGEFIILYSCEIQSSVGTCKTSFLNRKWKIKGKVLFYCQSPLTHTQE